MHQTYQKEKDLLSDMEATFNSLHFENQQQGERFRIQKEFETSKEIQGYIGRIGDLGIIDKKYDIAVTAACAKNLDSFLFRTSNDVDRAIQHLKRVQIGRANFYSLNVLMQKQKQLKLNPSPNPQKAQLLLDLIKYEKDEYRVAFEVAVRDTLVCQSYDDANDINRMGEGYRVVTLTGTVFEKNQCITGGGEQKGGAMKSEF